MKNKSGELIAKMLVIYKPLNEDWMGFKLTRNNPYTFHHIKEKRHGGRYEIQNGALLTREAHQFLNFLDLKCHEAYEDYQNIFRRIVKEGEVTEELKEEIYAMMLDIFYYDYYHLKRRFGSLSRFEEYTYADMQVKEDIMHVADVKEYKRSKRRH